MKKKRSDQITAIAVTKFPIQLVKTIITEYRSMSTDTVGNIYNNGN